MGTKQADSDFWERVEKGKDCWKWQGMVNGGGYGVYIDAGMMEYAHRWAYFALVGDIHPGQRLYNTCNNRDCVNPEHWSIEKPIPYRGMQYSRKKTGRKGNYRHSDAVIQAVRETADNSDLTQSAIAARYRISQAHVSRILAGRSRDETAARQRLREALTEYRQRENA